MAITALFENSGTIGTSLYSTVNNSTTAPASSTTAGIYQAFFDTNAIAAGDEFAFTCYEKVASGGTQRIVYQTVLVGPQGQPGLAFPALVLLNGWDFTMQKIAGTDRSIAWSIRQIA